MAPLHILLLVVLLAVLIGFVELGVLTAAFDKLGLSAHSAYLLLTSERSRQPAPLGIVGTFVIGVITPWDPDSTQ